MRYLGYVRRAALTARRSLLAGLMLTVALGVLLVPAPVTATIGVVVPSGGDLERTELRDLVRETARSVSRELGAPSWPAQQAPR